MLPVLSKVWNAVSYTLTYFMYVYGGKHIPKILYGSGARPEGMHVLWRRLYNGFLATEKVMVYCCMDARLAAFGQLFLHASLYGMMKRMYGVKCCFYHAAGAGPSVSEKDFPRLAAAHRASIIEGAPAANASFVIVIGHEHCARDTRDNPLKIEGLCKLARDVQKELPHVEVIAVFLHAQLIDWRKEILTHDEQEAEVLCGDAAASELVSCAS